MKRMGAYMTVDELTHGIGKIRPIPSVQIVDRYFDPALLDPKHIDTSLSGMGQGPAGGVAASLPVVEAAAGAAGAAAGRAGVSEGVKIFGMSLFGLVILASLGYIIYEHVKK